jgi:double zinc ribbon protein
MNPTLEIVIAIVFAAGAVWFTLQPILRPAGADPLGAIGDGEEDDFDEDTSPRSVALRALREIEFDRATGKLADADYDSLKAKYTAEAVAAVRAGAPDAPAPAARRAPAVAGAPGVPAPVCPVHGPRPESGAEFCAECGRPLGSGAGFCSRCGASLTLDAAFCNSCGTRVAA